MEKAHHKLTFVHSVNHTLAVLGGWLLSIKFLSMTHVNITDILALQRPIEYVTSSQDVCLVPPSEVFNMTKIKLKLL